MHLHKTHTVCWSRTDDILYTATTKNKKTNDLHHQQPHLTVCTQFNLEKSKLGLYAKMEQARKQKRGSLARKRTALISASLQNPALLAPSLSTRGPSEQIYGCLFWAFLGVLYVAISCDSMESPHVFLITIDYHC